MDKIYRINKMSSQRDYDLAGKVIGLAMKVHSVLGPGFLEVIYQNALCLELANAGIDFEVSPSISVFYEGKIVGQFSGDLLVEKTLLIENKAVGALVKAHEVQLVNYLTATKLDEGLLLNFGAASLEFKKKFRTYRAPEPPNEPPSLT